MKTLAEVFCDWEAVIGLEVHTELTTLNSKVFCPCKVEFGAPPNSQVCPICLGIPGTLPVLNRAAIESTVLAGLATNCTIEKQSMFYRKHYFYPDMTKNLQITQGPVAFCMRGGLTLEVLGASAAERTHLEGTQPVDQSNVNGASPADGYVTRIGITRIHLEEDAGKLVHIGGESGRISGADYSLVDYNRCGMGLIELVTEPDLRTPEEARLFLQKLRLIYLTLGISDCSMEQGSLRCDGNISLRRRGTSTFGTKTELKNMNSFKNLHDGLAFEICRQAELLESGGTVVQETRHWEPSKNRTIGMRSKETVADYYLFPDPDLAPNDLSDAFINEMRSRLPELPDARIARYVTTLQLSLADARILAGDIELARFFDRALEAAPQTASTQELAKPLANMLINEVSAYLNAETLSLEQTKLKPEYLLELTQLVLSEEISSKQGKEVLAQVFIQGVSPAELVEELGIKQVSNVEEIGAVAQRILDANPAKVAEYQAGKTGLLGFFVGQAMKATDGRANPKLINETFVNLLSKGTESHG
ncbi:MAG: Asp-tRNA(Asn)/Glu-tRNA(Gln) amidotransferase subunit GatB [Coriobacteriales bacterium]|jgi:aspartyl-tRNA(Asn)/glutamyl-tRNA(Gln) amidotransferase subunit B|nr:Asp-tRNA(Asn)/Glu-tRNA(Gln) amidotransferase subunit GatB [Coriobacteriales bacterium]